jgi:hypothetical protein
LKQKTRWEIFKNRDFPFSPSYFPREIDSFIYPPSLVILLIIEGKGVNTMARKAFGGMKISFGGSSDTLKDVFGGAPVSPSEMTKKLWVFIKKKGLMKK